MAQLSADLAVRHVEASALPADWRTLGTRDALQAIGRAWLEKGSSAVLAVPSAVVPAERNYLLNPHHRDFARIVTSESRRRWMWICGCCGICAALADRITTRSATVTCTSRPALLMWVSATHSPLSDKPGLRKGQSQALSFIKLNKNHRLVLFTWFKKARPHREFPASCPLRSASESR